jgi:hypothetical protein
MFIQRILKHLLVFCFVTISLGKVNAQFSNTSFWMRGIPQSSFANPSNIPAPGYYIGIPGISSHFSGISHSGFAFREFLRKDTENNFYWDNNHMLSKLKKNNLLYAALSHELLGFGFGLNQNYFSFSISENLTGNFSYPRDLMALLINGNDYFLQHDRIADFSGVGIEATHYRQFAFGFARQLNDKFYIGFRAKALSGLANVSMQRSKLTLMTQPDSYRLMVEANMIVNTSLPFPLALWILLMLKLT